MKNLIAVLLLSLCAFAQNPNSPKWPSANAADADLFVATNDASSTLNGAINNSVTSIVLTDATKFIPPVIVTIESEVIHCASRSSNTLTSCTRGSQGTSAASHADLKAVDGYMTAYPLNQMSVEIQAIESNAVRLNASNAYGSSAVNDARSAAHTMPAKTGAVSGLPASCTVGEEYFATDATAGRNKYYCTTTNTWTQAATGGTGGGTGARVYAILSANNPQTNTLAKYTPTGGYTTDIVLNQTGASVGGYANTSIVF